ncbi:MAG: transposase [Planctomycetaceae bacterium]|nr:transposase [Planctomycetaceae bacterium]
MESSLDEDQNDRDTLRHDPTFQIVCNRVPGEGPEIASHPTLSRLSNAVSISALKGLPDWMVDQLLDSSETPPTRLLFDLDGFGDVNQLRGCLWRTVHCARSPTVTWGNIYAPCVNAICAPGSTISSKSRNY